MWTRQSTLECRHSHSRARIVGNEARYSSHSRFLWLGTDNLCHRMQCDFMYLFHIIITVSHISPFIYHCQALANEQWCDLGREDEYARNFETNMFWFGTASSIVVRSLATWSAFGFQRNVIAIFLFLVWLIYGLLLSPPSTTMEVFLFCGTN